MRQKLSHLLRPLPPCTQQTRSQAHHQALASELQNRAEGRQDYRHLFHMHSPARITTIITKQIRLINFPPPESEVRSYGPVSWGVPQLREQQTAEWPLLPLHHHRAARQLFPAVGGDGGGKGVSPWGREYHPLLQRFHLLLPPPRALTEAHLPLRVGPGREWTHPILEVAEGEEVHWVAAAASDLSGPFTHFMILLFNFIFCHTYKMEGYY